jgi:ATP phosphoribosyltransferase regulatory subunit HisZ
MPLIKINTNGLGDIFICEPENLKLKMLLDALKDHIEVYGVDKLTAFLEGDNTDVLKETVIKLKTDLRKREEEFDELIGQIEDERELETIDCGLGKINYEINGSIVLQDVMENLGEAIKKTTPRKVNEVLSNI